MMVTGREEGMGFSEKTRLWRSSSVETHHVDCGFLHLGLKFFLFFFFLIESAVMESNGLGG